MAKKNRETRKVLVSCTHALTLLPSFVISSFSMAWIRDSSSLLTGSVRKKPSHFEAAVLIEMVRLLETASFPVIKTNFSSGLSRRVPLKSGEEGGW